MRKVMYENDEIKIDNGLFFGKGVFETILVKKKLKLKKYVVL